MGKKRLLGFLLAAGVLTLWVTSSFLIQTVLFDHKRYEKPIFMTAAQTSLCTVLLLPFCVKKLRSRVMPTNIDDGQARSNIGIPSVGSEQTWPGGNSEVGSTDKSDAVRPPNVGGPRVLDEAYWGDKSPPKVWRMAIAFSILWFGLQVLFNASLLWTSVPTATVLAATSGMQTFFLSLWLLKQPFKWMPFIAILLAFIGIILLATKHPTTDGSYQINDTWQGYVLSVVGATVYAIFVVCIDLKGEHLENNLTELFGWMGLWITLVSAPMLLLCHVTGIEKFETPEIVVVAGFLINGIFTIAADLMWTRSVLLIGPVLVTVILSMEMPVSLVIDWLILKQHEFQSIYIVGLTMVIAGVVWLTIVTNKEDAKNTRNEVNMIQALLADA
eukprot:Selendium_serpulae@DN6416_c0_g1_i6.p1